MKKKYIILCFLLSALAVGAQHRLLFDPSFSQDGQQHYSQTAGSWQGLLMQQDGKILAFGAFGTATKGICLARANPDGALDTSFNHTGVLHLNIAYSKNFKFAGAKLQSDGKIVAAGVGATPQSDFAYPVIYRFNPDGTLDSQFGNNGVVVRNLDSLKAYPVFFSILNDGRIVAVYLTSDNKSPANFMVEMFRVDSNGDPDTTLGADGAADLDIDRNPNGSNVVVDAQANIYILEHTYSGTNYKPTIYKINPEGITIDTFLIYQELSPDYNFAFNNFNIQPDGKFLLATESFTFGFALLRLNTDGKPDLSFSRDGIAIESPLISSYCKGILVQPDQKILINFGIAYGLARYNENGSLDYTLNRSGMVQAPLPPEGLPINNIGGAFGQAVQPDGKIVMGANINGNLYLARYDNKACTE